MKKDTHDLHIRLPQKLADKIAKLQATMQPKPSCNSLIVWLLETALSPVIPE